MQWALQSWCECSAAPLDRSRTPEGTAQQRGRSASDTLSMARSLVCVCGRWWTVRWALTRCDTVQGSSAREVGGVEAAGQMHGVGVPP